MPRAISEIASVAAIAYARGSKDVAEHLFREAVGKHNEVSVREEFVNAFAVLAGECRREREHGKVCRLKLGINAFRPSGMTKAEVRQLLLETGAAGYSPRQPSSSTVSMLALDKG